MIQRADPSEQWRPILSMDTRSKARSLEDYKKQDPASSDIKRLRAISNLVQFEISGTELASALRFWREENVEILRLKFSVLTVCSYRDHLQPLLINRPSSL